MNTENNSLTLDDILDNLIASTENLDVETVSKYVKDYPQYRNELMDFAARWSVLKHTPLDTSPIKNEEQIAASGRETVLHLLREKKANMKADIAQTSAPASAINSLLEAAKTNGLNIRQLAIETGLSIPIIAKLESRLIAFASIPKEAIERIATATKTSGEQVTNFLKGAPRFASEASYKSETQPELPEQQDFYEVVRSDLKMKKEEKDYWMSLNKE